MTQKTISTTSPSTAMRRERLDGSAPMPPLQRLSSTARISAQRGPTLRPRLVGQLWLLMQEILFGSRGIILSMLRHHQTTTNSPYLTRPTYMVM